MKRNRKSRPALKTWRTPAAVSSPAVVSLSDRLVLRAVKAEDRREEAVGHRRARRLVGFAGEESARAGGGGHAAISISVVGAVSSKNRASRSAASVVIAVRGIPPCAATSPTVSAVAPATVRVSSLEWVAWKPRA